MSGRDKEIVFEGLGVSPGIAVGPAHLSEAGMPAVPEYAIRKSDVGAENDRLKTAVERSGRQLRRLRDRARSVHGASGEDLGNLLDAYLQMLTGSRLVRGVERRIAELRINAEAAVQAEISDIAHSFEDLPDPYMAARADDVREAGARLIRNLRLGLAVVCTLLLVVTFVGEVNYRSIATRVFYVGHLALLLMLWVALLLTIEIGRAHV